MLLALVQQTAPLTQRLQVPAGILARVMVEVGAGEHDSGLDEQPANAPFPRFNLSADTDPIDVVGFEMTLPRGAMDNEKADPRLHVFRPTWFKTAAGDCKWVDAASGILESG